MIGRSEEPNNVRDISDIPGNHDKNGREDR